MLLLSAVMREAMPLAKLTEPVHIGNFIGGLVGDAPIVAASAIVHHGFKVNLCRPAGDACGIGTVEPPSETIDPSVSDWQHCHCTSVNQLRVPL